MIKQLKYIMWSEYLQQQTKEAINELRCDKNGNIYFKHKKCGYTKASIEDLLNNKYILHQKSNTTALHFATINDLILAGWCID